MRLPPLPRRGPEAQEWLDAGVGTADEARASYRDLDRVNQRLGGHRATRVALEPLLADAIGLHPERFTIVDVAGGSGDFAGWLAERVERRGGTVRAWCVDRSRVATETVRSRDPDLPRVDPVRADALELPLADRSVDLVHSATFLHHLGSGEALGALAEMCRVSRRLVVVNDLVRSRVALAGTWLVTRAISTNRLVRHDGPLSVRKAFLPRELRSLAHAVGLAGGARWRWRLARSFPYRMTLVGVRPPGT